MDHLESVTERDEGYFVDLFVRESNVNAINMYKRVSDHSFHAYCIIYACPYERGPCSRPQSSDPKDSYHSNSIVPRQWSQMLESEESGRLFLQAC